MLTVFWCSTSYTAICALWKIIIEPANALIRCWLCACLKCVSGLRWLEKNMNILRCILVIVLVLKFSSDTNDGNRLQLWPARTTSNREFLGCVYVFELVLLYGSKLNEGYWLQLLFHFIVFISVVASFNGMSFFRCFRFYFDTFSYCTLTKTFALGFQKWLDNDWVFSGVFGRLYLVLSTRFSKFCANFLLMFYIVYCNMCALKDINWAC